jgi:hypothetical protein
MSQEEGPMHSLCLQLPCVSQSFFWGEKSAKGELVFCKGNILLQMPILKKGKIAKLRQKTCFAAEGVRRFMPSGYTFMTFVGKSRQLS